LSPVSWSLPFHRNPALPIQIRASPAGVKMIKVGTRVAYASDYLQSIGSDDALMKNLRGKVIAFEDVDGWPMVVVLWDSGHTQLVAISNLKGEW
jgi:hypothetical protein